jgi:tetratricopeptide (TPR) repeat protein
MKKNLVIVLLSFIISYNAQVESDKKKNQKLIIEECITNCSKKINFYMFMNDYQACIDKGIAKDSTIAYLWQQKCMPYFKVKKYAVGMRFLNKAVELDKFRYLAYRGFMNCIFVKDYENAIADFTEAVSLYGNNYEMDHTYNFYIALSYLQLNRFEEAENLFKSEIESQKLEKGFVHHLMLFYFGISQFEQSKWAEANATFDLALKDYNTFSDAQYYKALSLIKLNKYNEAQALFKLSQENFKKGYSINEDNTIYEDYPYHYKWR